MAIHIIVTVIIASLSFISGITSNSCNFNAKAKQALLNEGFHRNITYGIVFNSDDDDERWLYEDCIVSLEQILPPGVFANPDELGELRRLHRLNAIPKNRINVELPAAQAQPSTVYLMGTVTQSKVSLWLPVHARYQHAVAGGGYARNRIEPAKLYLRCPDQRLDFCNKRISSMTFLCNGSSKEKCSWMQVPYISLTDTLIWDVPVGNTDHYRLVAAGTGLAVAAGALSLLVAAHGYQLRARKKIT